LKAQAVNTRLRSVNMAAMKKADILKQREIHRGDPQEHVLRFMVNYSAQARMMHSFLPPTKGKEDVLQAAMRAYVIGIAACVETFFRDLYVDLLKRNPGLMQQALSASSRKAPASHLSRYVAEGVSAEEFAAFQASFQNAEAINQNISILFSIPFFDVLDRFELVCDIPSARHSGPARLKLPPCWRSDLDRVFSLRHEFAHDANSKTQVSAGEMQRIETSALLICQVTALLPGIEAPIIVSGRQLPVILLIPDLISEDWEIVEDETAAT
jgi:hypothetical protein